VLHRALGREPFDDLRIHRFLKDDDVGLALLDHGRNRLLAADPSNLDVVAEQSERHGSDSGNVPKSLK